jgi:hypothetical protein
MLSSYSSRRDFHVIVARGFPPTSLDGAARGKMLLLKLSRQRPAVPSSGMANQSGPVNRRLAGASESEKLDVQI